MSEGPTKGAAEQRQWTANPAMAIALRLAIPLAPLVASYLTARAAAPGLWRPAGWPGTVAYIVQMALIGTAAALLVRRAVQRVVPLAALLNMTLVFPDRAPSRFGIALRSGTVKQLKNLDDKRPADHQEAAEQLVAMVTALGRHERLTRGHTERVRAYSDLIGQELGLTEEERQKLAWGALAHDVGKLTVPAEILSAAGKPTDEEWAILRNHPVAGAEMVQPLADWLGEWRLAAGQHHERWDGGGYPAGLSGDDISLAGRIVAVADAYDVITSARSYKKAMAPEAAREEMVRCAGSQFDPTVVRALLEVSLTKNRSRWTLLGWLGELGRVSFVPRGVVQSVTTAVGGTVAPVATAGVVAVSAAAAPATPELVPFPDGLALVAPPSEETVPTSEVIVDQDNVTVEDVTADESPVAAAPPNLGTSTADTDSTSSVPTSTSLESSTTEPTLVPGEPATSSPDTTLSVTTTKLLSTTATTTTTTTSAPATTTTTITSTTTTYTTTPVGSTVWYPGDGSQKQLPLDGSLTSGSLPNYDPDRDGEPGLLLQKGDGLAETDSTKMQQWEAPISTMAGTHLQATPTLALWVAVKDFEVSKTGRLVVGLYDCRASGKDCTLLAQATATFDQSDFGADFGRVDITFASIDHHFGNGRTLLLKVAPLTGSDDDLWLAYGTTTYPMTLIT